jgi:hypothetical protein
MWWDSEARAWTFTLIHDELPRSIATPERLGYTVVGP